MSEAATASTVSLRFLPLFPTSDSILWASTVVRRSSLKTTGTVVFSLRASAKTALFSARRTDSPVHVLGVTDDDNIGLLVRYCGTDILQRFSRL